MATIRNISEHTLNVRALNRSVDPDELVEVPDDVFNEYEWPETLWDVTAPKKTAKSSGKGES